MKLTLTLDDYRQAALTLQCEVSTIMAVGEVEAPKGGFLDDGSDRPTILFERHVFSRLTQHEFDKIASDISSPQAGGYRGGSAEYDRLARACALSSDLSVTRSAKLACSWGKFQLMGFNWSLCGSGDFDAFLLAVADSEASQLELFCRFIAASRLAPTLRYKDYATFALRYNGPKYTLNHYDTKLATADKKFASLGVNS